MEKECLNSYKKSSFNIRLLKDVYVNEVLNLLDELDMCQKKEDFSIILSKTDEMYELVQSLEKSLYDLENEIQKLEDPKAKELLNEMLNEIKENYNAHKNKAINQKEEVIESCKLLVETFKACGKGVFLIAFEITRSDFKKNLMF